MRQASVLCALQTASASAWPLAAKFETHCSALGIACCQQRRNKGG
jgi:hypothetical protein